MSDTEKLEAIEAYIRRYRYRKDFGYKDGSNTYVDQMLKILDKSDPIEHATWEEINQEKAYIRDAFCSHEGLDDEDDFTIAIAELSGKLPPVELFLKHQQEQEQAANSLTIPHQKVVYSVEQYGDYTIVIYAFTTGGYHGISYKTDPSKRQFSINDSNVKTVRDSLIDAIQQKENKNA